MVWTTSNSIGCGLVGLDDHDRSAALGPASSGGHAAHGRVGVSSCSMYDSSRLIFGSVGRSSRFASTTSGVWGMVEMRERERGSGSLWRIEKRVRREVDTRLVSSVLRDDVESELVGHRR